MNNSGVQSSESPEQESRTNLVCLQRNVCIGRGRASDEDVEHPFKEGEGPLSLIFF